MVKKPLDDARGRSLVGTRTGGLRCRLGQLLASRLGGPRLFVSVIPGPPSDRCPTSRKVQPAVARTAEFWYQAEGMVAAVPYSFLRVKVPNVELSWEYCVHGGRNIVGGFVREYRGINLTNLHLPSDTASGSDFRPIWGCIKKPC